MVWSFLLKGQVLMMPSSFVDIKIVTAVTLTVAMCALRAVWLALTDPPGIPSPPLPPQHGKGIVDRYIKRFLLQHFYVVRQGEFLFCVLKWTRLFNHRPFSIRIFFYRHIVVSNAADIEEILLKQESSFSKRTGYDLLRASIGNGLLTMGDKRKHREQRRIFQPVFVPLNVKRIANEVMRVHVLRLLGTLSELLLHAGGDSGVVTINLSDYMCRMAFAIVSEAAFHSTGEDSSVALNAFVDRTKFNMLNYFCPFYRSNTQQNAEKILMKVFTQIIQKYSDDDDGSQRWEVLNALMDNSNVRFSKEDILGHLTTFLFAGQDTTSSTLHFLFALLSRDEKVQDCLYEELKEIMPTPCTCSTIEELLECEYLTAVVWEAMRLFPAAPLLYRDSDNEVYLPASGVTIPKGSICVINIFGVHRSVEIYGLDADAFRPGRWMGDEGRKLRDKCGCCGYIPFGAGARHCIGGEYGVYEVMITTAVLVRHLRFDSVGPFPRLRFTFTLTSPDPCRVKLTIREEISNHAIRNIIHLLHTHAAAMNSVAPT